MAINISNVALNDVIWLQWQLWTWR